MDHKVLIVLWNHYTWIYLCLAPKTCSSKPVVDYADRKKQSTLIAKCQFWFVKLNNFIFSENNKYSESREPTLLLLLVKLIGKKYEFCTGKLPGLRKSRFSCFAGLPVEPWRWSRTWRLASRTTTSTSRNWPNRLWDSAFRRRPTQAPHRTVRSRLRFSNAWSTKKQKNAITVRPTTLWQQRPLVRSLSSIWKITVQVQ